ncbi:MAG: cytochrome P450 [Leptolyngbya sp. SIO4C1]|nr:cytochrome P450 [Leptolyngbya sp. SIO4C1]
MFREYLPLGNRAVPVSYPIVGQVPYWLLDRFGFLEACAASRASIFELKLGRRAYLLNHHEDIKHVLATNYTNYSKNARLSDRTGQRLFGDGVQTQYGSQHQHQRRQVQPAFMRRAIAAFAPQIVATVEAKLSTWHSHTDIDIVPELIQLVHCVLGQVLFSLDFDRQDRAFGEAVMVRRRQVNDQFSLKAPFVKLWRDGRHSLNSQVLQQLEAQVDQMIQARRHEPYRYRDLLSTLVQLRSSSSSPMSDKQLRDEALATTGGYETIAAAVIWTVYLLAQQPQIEDKLAHEISQIVGNRLPTAEDIPALKYSKQILNEALRLYPPTWIFTRTANQPDCLPSGTKLEPGTKLYLSPYVVHRNPAYFPKPERFEPERFSKAGKQTRPEFVYFPFGGGPRVCIGQTLAETFATLILIAMVQRVRLTLVSDQTAGQRLVKRPSITLLPDQSLKMRKQLKAQPELSQ